MDSILDDIWMRDLFVTQLSDTSVVRFSYSPAYLYPMEVHYIDNSARRLVDKIWPNGEVQQLELVLDGGGIVWEPSTRRAVVTERVLRDNPALLVNRTSLSANGLPPRPNGAAAPYAGAPAISNAELSMAKVRLEAILSAALAGASVTVAIVPEQAGAPRLGHVDGICNWLGPSTIALSNFSDASTYSSYVTRLTDAFGTGVTIVPFPYHPTTDVWEVDGFESASGIYVNFARTQRALYLPTFGLAADADALALVTAHADVPPVAIDARGVAGMGGSVRCLSSFPVGRASRRAREPNCAGAVTGAGCGCGGGRPQHDGPLLRRRPPSRHLRRLPARRGRVEMVEGEREAQGRRRR